MYYYCCEPPCLYFVTYIVNMWSYMLPRPLDSMSSCLRMPYFMHSCTQSVSANSAIQSSKDKVSNNLLLMVVWVLINHFACHLVKAQYISFMYNIWLHFCYQPAVWLTYNINCCHVPTVRILCLSTICIM